MQVFSCTKFLVIIIYLYNNKSITNGKLSYEKGGGGNKIKTNSRESVCLFQSLFLGS